MSSQVTSWIQNQRELEASHRELLEEVAELRRFVSGLQSKPAPKPSARQLERIQIKTVLGSLADRVSNPFIFTGALLDLRAAGLGLWLTLFCPAQWHSTRSRKRLPTRRRAR